MIKVITIIVIIIITYHSHEPAHLGPFGHESGVPQLQLQLARVSRGGAAQFGKECREHRVALVMIAGGGSGACPLLLAPNPYYDRVLGAPSGPVIII
jgi:hypothetical protein